MIWLGALCSVLRLARSKHNDYIAPLSIPPSTYCGNAYYGFESINLGLPGSGLPTLQSQVIAGFASNAFWLGSLGLSPVPFNFTDLDEPQPSMMGTLKNQSLIPSTSWAYTAGAYYKSPPVLGSLTLGGYDTTRFQPNNVSFAFYSDFSRDLQVSLQYIAYDTVGSTPLLASGIDIFIDSLVTEIWLPINVCQAFESAFDLHWDNTAQLYIIDDNVHNALLAQNPTFTFNMGQAGGGGVETVDIVLPYAAFDLNVTQPLVGATSRYFPLKQAQNSTQYILGRTFLQEAYIIADYDRQNFSVFQAVSPSPSVSQDIVAIHPPSSSQESGGDGGLNGGAIAGIVIGAVVILAAAIAAAMWLGRLRSKIDRQPAQYFVDEMNGDGGHRLYPSLHEADGETQVHQLDERHAIGPELHGHSSHLGRHELGQDVKVYEIGSGDMPAVELDTPGG
ncbi:hypothetical protein LTR22_019971 [Elasticomyces elasticus]|nr:hypothetical protein LTR22_019971 [Elasticomyces elasticus]